MPILANESDMNKTEKTEEMLSHYDFSGGVRGQYAAAYAKGTNVVVIAPDLVKIFPDSESVNEALRTLVRISGKTARITKSPKTRA